MMQMLGLRETSTPVLLFGVLLVVAAALAPSLWEDWYARVLVVGIGLMDAYALGERRGLD